MAVETPAPSFLQSVSCRLREASRCLLRFLLGRARPRSGVLWFTGLSGSGKTTLARLVCAELRRRGLRCEHLDGDAIRQLFPGTGFSKPERDMHIHRAGHLAAALERNGVFVVASFVSPYAESRDFVRRLCSAFAEVHLDASLEACERRDPKGLYARARRGEIRDFTGVHDPYEAPARPELRIDTARLSADESLARVMAYIDEHFLAGAR